MFCYISFSLKYFNILHDWECYKTLYKTVLSWPLRPNEGSGELKCVGRLTNLNFAKPWNNQAVLILSHETECLGYFVRDFAFTLLHSTDILFNLQHMCIFFFLIGKIFIIFFKNKVENRLSNVWSITFQMKEIDFPVMKMQTLLRIFCCRKM